MNDDFQKLIYVHINGYSMQPLLYSNDVVLVKCADCYVPGDIVVFKYNNDRVIAHRIIKYIEFENLYICKGDNSFQIEKIDKSKIIGKVVFMKRNHCLRILPNASMKFILLSFAVNQEFLRNNYNVKETIKSNTYKYYIKERNLLCKI